MPVIQKWPKSVSIISYIIELPHYKTNKIACAPSEDSDQPGHPPSLIRVFAVCMKKYGILRSHWAHSEDSDQTGQMPRLIWVYAGRTVILLVLSWGGSIVYSGQLIRFRHRCLALIFNDQIKEHYIYMYIKWADMRLWHLSPSINSVFNYACAAIHWGFTSGFWSDPSSASIIYVCEEPRLWQDCAVSPERSLFAYVISTIISWAGSNFL